MDVLNMLTGNQTFQKVLNGINVHIVLLRMSYGEEEKGNQTQPFLRARIT